MNILSALAYEILSEHGYPVVQDEERNGSVQSLINLDSGVYRFELISGSKRQDFTLYLRMPENIPERHRFAVMELLTRLNYRLAIGHFEMDLDDGEVRFVHRQLTEGVNPSHDLLLTLMRISLDLVDTWCPGMLRIVQDGLHPQAVMAEIDEACGYDGRYNGRYPSHRLN
jgi:hypothetical protein